MADMIVYVLVLVSVFVSVASAPAHDEARALTIELSEVLNKSVCPIKVVINDNPTRIPRRIKELKCAKTPNPLCQHPGMAHACCRHHHARYETQCAEVVDHVLVSYGGREPVPMQVSVGCACMIREGTMAATGQ